jgi:hypothetical protein
MQSKILGGLGIAFIFSMFLAMILDNSIGYGIMGVLMFGFLFYALFATFRLFSPVKFYKEINRRAGEDVKSPKFWGYTFTGAMVAVGLIWVVISMFVYFIYYV